MHLGSNQNQRTLSCHSYHPSFFFFFFFYGCETWTTYQRHMKKHFHTTFLRKILGITLQKNISSTLKFYLGFLFPASTPSWISPRNLSISPFIAWSIWRRTDKWHRVKVCEARRNATIELCRKLRKSTATILCSHCPRLFCAQIGLISHLCTHGSCPQS